MENSMTGIGIELALLLKGVKYLGICLFVWFIEPILGFFATLGFFVMQINTGVLTPEQRIILDDYKIILAVLVPTALLVKYIIDIYKSRKSDKKK